MRRLGVIRNPRSTGNRRHANGWGDVARHSNIVGFEQPENAEDLGEALVSFMEREADGVVISGGDGTISDVLSALRYATPGWNPDLAIVRSGKTNLIARDVGGAPPGSAGVLALADAARRGVLAKPCLRPVLKVETSEQCGHARWGFFLGAGAFTQASDLAQVEAHAYGLNEGPAILWTLGSMVARTLIGREAGEFGPAVVASCPAGLTERGACFLVIATTLDRMILGLRPFWGANTGPIRFTDVVDPPRRLGAAILPILRGRPKDWMSDAGYRSGATTELRLRLNGRLTLDGEPFSAGPSGEVVVTAAETIAFHSLPQA